MNRVASSLGLLEGLEELSKYLERQAKLASGRRGIPVRLRKPLALLRDLNCLVYNARLARCALSLSPPASSTLASPIPAVKSEPPPASPVSSELAIPIPPRPKIEPVDHPNVHLTVKFVCDNLDTFFHLQLQDIEARITAAVRMKRELKTAAQHPIPLPATTVGNRNGAHGPITSSWSHAPGIHLASFQLPPPAHPLPPTTHPLPHLAANAALPTPPPPKQDRRIGGIEAEVQSLLKASVEQRSERASAKTDSFLPPAGFHTLPPPPSTASLLAALPHSSAFAALPLPQRFPSTTILQPPGLPNQLKPSFTLAPPAHFPQSRFPPYFAPR